MRAVIALLLFAGNLAAEELVLRGSAIKALEGLPTVSFVVPWQASTAPSYIAMPPDSILDDYLHPLDSTLLPGGAQHQQDNDSPLSSVKQP